MGLTVSPFLKRQPAHWLSSWAPEALLPFISPKLVEQALPFEGRNKVLWRRLRVIPFLLYLHFFDIFPYNRVTPSFKLGYSLLKHFLCVNTFSKISPWEGPLEQKYCNLVKGEIPYNFPLLHFFIFFQITKLRLTWTFSIILFHIF